MAGLRGKNINIATFQENFANHSDVKFAEEYRTENVKSEDFVGFDLCVLASSDHTLITYGSFGLWGAVLSRGDVIAAKGTNNETYSEVSLQYNECYAIYFTYW